MELKDAMIKAEEKLEINKKSVNKIINECNIAEAYLISKNVFKKIHMITTLKEKRDQLILLGWEHCPNHKSFKLMYIIEDEVTGEEISKRTLLECPLHTRAKMHEFLGDFIIHVANQTIKDCDYDKGL